MIAWSLWFCRNRQISERSAPLWALMLATVWLDIIFVPLFDCSFGNSAADSPHAGYGGMIIHADYTHSIVGMLALSAALGAMFLPRLGRRVATVIALVSASHWVLDLVVHRAACLCSPGTLANFPTLGLGLWNHALAAAWVELVLVVAGATMYWRAAMEVSVRAGRNGRLASLSAAMIAAFGLLLLFLDSTS